PLFLHRKEKSLCHSLGKPSRSDFVQFKFVELRKSKLAQFLNSTQTAVSVVPLLVLCWYHRTIK
ncbi:hypothetical protein, partial [Ruminococcus sp. RTP21484sp1]|uniref:hypothetical protein n=1 Tax=Ruminococcus sp. RTP21484sp1 TaxID=3151395 RepID=UPI003218F70F